MLTYTFSRREKFLIGMFSLLLVAVAWYRLVYVTTTDKLAQLEEELEQINSQIVSAQTKLALQREMEQVIAQRIAEGAVSKPMPEYDNIEPLMKDISPVIQKADHYSVSFEDVDTTTTEYVLRGVTMTFVCKTYEEVEDILTSLADGQYPCVINQVTIAPDRTGSLYSATTHVVYYERPNAEMVAEREAKAAAEAAAAAAAAEASE